LVQSGPERGGRQGWSRLSALASLPVPLPRDFFKLARAVLADPLHRRLQPSGRVVLHDASATLAAKDTLIHGMVAIAFDIADLAVLDMHIDATATGAHIAGRLGDPVADRAVQIVWARRSARIMSLAFSPIMMVGALVLPLTMVGMTEASANLRLATPCTRSLSSTTAMVS